MSNTEQIKNEVTNNYKDWQLGVSYQNSDWNYWWWSCKIIYWTVQSSPQMNCTTVDGITYNTEVVQHYMKGNGNLRFCW